MLKVVKHWISLLRGSFKAPSVFTYCHTGHNLARLPVQILQHAELRKYHSVSFQLIVLLSDERDA